MPHRTALPSLCLAAAVLVALSLLACNGDGGPTSLGSTLVLTRATISVNGQVVNGQTLPRGHGQGGTARFEAVLEQDGVRVTGGSVTVRHDSPGGMMMGNSRDFLLYDDGTHGDHTPGDGLYCYEDFQGEYGCHTNQAAMGQHHYQFHGTDGHGHQSNMMDVSVTIRE